MTVVEVGYVRVSVAQLVVDMPVLMADPALFGVSMGVMAVIVGVFVIVFSRLVAVVVEVVAVQHTADTECGDAEREQFARCRRLTEDRPRHDRSDERSRREHELPTRRTEIASTGHPQRDRCSIAEAADHQRAEDGPPSGRATENEADREVGASGHDALDEGDVGGGELVEVRGHGVVDTPAQARPGDQQRTDAQVTAAGPAEHAARDDDERSPDNNTSAEVLAEDEEREDSREDQFEVEQQRRCRRRGVAQACREQDRTHSAADDHREPESRCGPHECSTRRSDATHDGEHGDRRAEIEEPGERERAHVLGEP